MMAIDWTSGSAGRFGHGQAPGAADHFDVAGPPAHQGVAAAIKSAYRALPTELPIEIDRLLSRLP